MTGRGNSGPGGVAVLIKFRQSGGVAGVPRPPVVIDTAALPAGEAGAWQELVAGADFFALPATTPAGPARDAFAYEITVEADGRSHSVRTTDATLPPALRPLVDRLRAAGRPRG